jgi:hypothetical protein
MKIRVGTDMSRREVLQRFKNYPPGWYSVYDYQPEKKAWLGIVLKKQITGVITVMTMGLEPTEEAIKAWCKAVIAHRMAGGDPDDDPHDMQDREARTVQ